MINDILETLDRASEDIQNVEGYHGHNHERLSQVRMLIADAKMLLRLSRVRTPEDVIPPKNQQPTKPNE